ncbi:hypothetical protein L211DRAFT_501611 [Terfezia boudieri ATCC MYA-4762]|uniref:Uncharacterized protein n=1 Tax=Terfezia boudieri ATCC MYA-4762 TaxID=1051890 RepID=A0A3N4LGX9_9PEZI|nr:hypothetical protein L211DRAFT_501611 [Terfezia boudieri ATCC MYA-4762]
MLAKWKFPLAVIASLLPIFFVYFLCIYTYRSISVLWLWLPRSWFSLGRNPLFYLGSLFCY